PLDRAAIREEIGNLLDALQFIHPARQLIIFRRFFDDASYQEIGDELGKPREWVRRQHLSAQKEIRTLLEHRS
ncbi:MAG: sigma factor-like helix-turn-helix DNA-binding protein, partial [Pirellulaceae bacterium]